MEISTSSSSARRGVVATPRSLTFMKAKSSSGGQFPEPSSDDSAGVRAPGCCCFPLLLTHQVWLLAPPSPCSLQGSNSKSESHREMLPAWNIMERIMRIFLEASFRTVKRVPFPLGNLCKIHASKWNSRVPSPSSIPKGPSGWPKARFRIFAYCCTRSKLAAPDCSESTRQRPAR